MIHNCRTEGRFEWLPPRLFLNAWQRSTTSVDLRSDHDVRQLNDLQLLHAAQNVYFNAAANDGRRLLADFYQLKHGRRQYFLNAQVGPKRPVDTETVRQQFNVTRTHVRYSLNISAIKELKAARSMVDALAKTPGQLRRTPIARTWLQYRHERDHNGYQGDFINYLNNLQMSVRVK